jgi:hypothetical protein
MRRSDRMHIRPSRPADSCVCEPQLTDVTVLVTIVILILAPHSATVYLAPVLAKKFHDLRRASRVNPAGDSSCGKR